MSLTHLNPLPMGQPQDAVPHAVLMREGEPFRFRRGDVLWEAGAPARWVVVLTSGTIKLTRPWKGDRAVVLDLAARGDVLGEEAALGQTKALATCQAITSGRGHRIPARRAQGVLTRDPGFCRALLLASTHRSAQLAARLGHLTDGQVHARLARVLFDLAAQRGLPDARGRFVPLRLSREELAGMVGCRSETVIRTLTRWKEQQLVETVREGLIVREMEELAAVAGHARQEQAA